MSSPDNDDLIGRIVLGRYRSRRDRPHLAWWAVGIYIYGLGTLTESLVTLFGWNPFVFRAWYISGALLGGVPLAQGSVYFHFTRRTANRMTAIVVLVRAHGSPFCNLRR